MYSTLPVQVHRQRFFSLSENVNGDLSCIVMLIGVSPQIMASSLFFLNYLPVPCLHPKLAVTLMQPSVDTHVVPFPSERALTITSTVFSDIGGQSACSYNPPDH